MWGKKTLFSSASSSTSSSSSNRKPSNAEETVPPIDVSATNAAQPAGPVSPSQHQHSFQVSSKDNVPEHPYPTSGEPKKEPPASGDVVLTISNDISSKVQEVRDLKLKNGKVTVDNIAETISTPSVSFVALSEPQAKITTQSLKKKEDMDSKLRNVLHAHLGEKVIVKPMGSNSNNRESVEGILQLVGLDHIILSNGNNTKENNNEEAQASDSVVSSGVQLIPILPSNGYVISDPLPNIVSSVLNWTIDSKSESLLSQFSYGCTGLKWGIEYNVKANHNFTQLHLTGWYTLENSTGANFENSKIVVVEKIVEVREEYRSKNPKELMFSSFSKVSSSSSNSNNIKKRSNKSNRVEKGTKRYHLPRKVTLPSYSTIEENAVNVTVPSKRFHVVKPRPAKFSGKVDLEDRSVSEVYTVQQVVSFLNSEENQLGFALPAGFCATFVVEDEDSSLVSVEPFRFQLGDDVAILPIGKPLQDADVLRKKIEFHADSKRHVIKESFEVVISNKTSGDLLDLIVEENLPRWHEWDVTGSATITPLGQTAKNPFVDFTCEKHERKQNRLVFSVPVVPFASVVTITYTAVYSNY